MLSTQKDVPSTASVTCLYNAGIRFELESTSLASKLLATSRKKACDLLRGRCTFSISAAFVVCAATIANAKRTKVKQTAAGPKNTHEDTEKYARRRALCTYRTPLWVEVHNPLSTQHLDNFGQSCWLIVILFLRFLLLLLLYFSLCVNDNDDGTDAESETLSRGLFV